MATKTEDEPRKILTYNCKGCGSLVRDGDICCEEKRFYSYQCSKCETIYFYKTNAENCSCETQ